MNMFFNSILREADVPDAGGGGDPTPTNTPDATPDMSQYVPKADYDKLQGELGSANGRAKANQNIMDIARKNGYETADAFAEVLPSILQPKKESSFEAQYPSNTDTELDANQPSGLTLEDVNRHIDSTMSAREAASAHKSGKATETQLITAMLGEKEFKGVFKGLESGDSETIFSAAFSGKGSAAQEMVASAIENAVFGLTATYGDDAPEALRGRAMPITDPAIMAKAKARVIEGLKDLAAMSIFAASKKGIDAAPDPVSPSADGKDQPPMSKEERERKMTSFIDETFEKHTQANVPASV